MSNKENPSGIAKFILIADVVVKARDRQRADLAVLADQLDSLVSMLIASKALETVEKDYEAGTIIQTLAHIYLNLDRLNEEAWCGTDAMRGTDWIQRYMLRCDKRAAREAK